jgi:large subunit ribosomal protein L25
MLQVEISASVRNTSGKGPMRQLRMQGLTPAVVYGGGAEAQMLQLDTKTLMAQLLQFYRKNAVVTLDVDGGAKKNVIVGEVQTDPVRDTLLHVDFFEIDLDKERAFNVPIVLKGTAKGVDMGGFMAANCSHLVLQGKPMDIPDECVLDVSSMEIGTQKRARRLRVPANVTMLTDPMTVVVSIMKPGEKPVEDLDDEEEVVAVEAVEAATEE